VPSRGLCRCSASRRRLMPCSRPCGSVLPSLACGVRTQGVQNEPLATLTLCSLLWPAPRYSLLGSVAAPALSPLSLSSLLSPFLVPLRPPLHTHSSGPLRPPDLSAVLWVLLSGAPVVARCYALLYCGAEGPLRPPPAPSLRVELPRVDPVVGRRWVSSPWGSGAPHPRCWLRCGPLRY